MLDALSPQHRRLVLGVGVLILLLIMAIAVDAVICSPAVEPVLRPRAPADRLRQQPVGRPRHSGAAVPGVPTKPLTTPLSAAAIGMPTKTATAAAPTGGQNQALPPADTSPIDSTPQQPGRRACGLQPVVECGRCISAAGRAAPADRARGTSSSLRWSRWERWSLFWFRGRAGRARGPSLSLPARR